MLDTVREYAEHMLAASDEDKATRTRHLEYYVGLVGIDKTGTHGPRSGHLARATRPRNRERPRRASLLRHMRRRGGAWPAPGLVADAVLDVPRQVRARPPPHDRGASRGLPPQRTIFPAAARCSAPDNSPCLSGEYDEAEALPARKSRDLSRVEEPAATSAVLAQLAVAAIRQASPQHGARLPRRIACARRKLGDKRKLAAALNETGQLDRLEGDFIGCGHNYKAASRSRRKSTTAKALPSRFSTSQWLSWHLRRPAIRGPRRSRCPRDCSRDRIAPTAQTLFEVTAVLAPQSKNWRQRSPTVPRRQETLSAETGAACHPADEAFWRQ